MSEYTIAKIKRQTKRVHKKMSRCPGLSKIRNISLHWSRPCVGCFAPHKKEII